MIINEVKEAEVFSLGVDETRDVNRHEQVSFVIQYLDSNGEIQEWLLGMDREFYHC